MKTVLTLVLSLCCAAQATVLPRSIQTPEAEEPTMFTALTPETVSITGRTTYDDRTTWRGYPVMGSNSTVIPGISLGYKGLVADLSGYLPTDSGYELSKRMDLLLAYLGQLQDFEYNVGYGYYMYPEGASPSSENPNIQEAFATLAYPMGTLRPRVTMVYAWPDEDECNRSSGALYVGGIDWQPSDRLLAFAELAYNDGLSPFASDDQAESDWSYVLAGIQYDIPLNDGSILRPGIYHQIVFEESHNPEDDQTWLSIGLHKPF